MQIGELSRLTGISTRMLRHYDSIGLVSPRTREANGYRDYSDDDIRRLAQVESLKTLGLSLHTIRDTFDDADLTPIDLVDELIAGARARIAREQEVILRLEGVRESSAASWTDVLAVVALMRGLKSPDASHRLRVVLAAADAAPTSTLVEALVSESDLNVSGALHWALSRSADGAATHLAAAVDSSDEQTRHQAMAVVAKLKPADSLPILREARRHSDPLIRERASLALGSHGEVDVVPDLIDMIVRGSHDVDAADVLGHLVRRHDLADHVVAEITGRLDIEHEIPGARGRLTQALGEMPGPAAHCTLAGLIDDHDRVVSVTATYLLTVHSR